MANGSSVQFHDKHEYYEHPVTHDDDYPDDLDDYDEEDEDIDALIDELESQDGDNVDYEEEEDDRPGGARVVPEELLQTDTRLGLNSAEVLLRRKKFGYNRMKGLLHLQTKRLCKILTSSRGEGESVRQVSHVLRWPDSIRHGSCGDSRGRFARLG